MIITQVGPDKLQWIDFELDSWSLIAGWCSSLCKPLCESVWYWQELEHAAGHIDPEHCKHATWVTCPLSTKARQECRWALFLCRTHRKCENTCLHHCICSCCWVTCRVLPTFIFLWKQCFWFAVRGLSDHLLNQFQILLRAECVFVRAKCAVQGACCVCRKHFYKS